MCNWIKWVWPGIFATIFLTAIAMLVQSKNIENDLTAKATGELSEQYSWASVELDGRDLTLTGLAPSQEAQQTALKLADDAYDVRIANNASTLIPIADPYKLSALKDGNTVILSGFVPSEAVRVEQIATAKAMAPNADIIDKMSIARGAPAGFAALSAFAIGQLKGLGDGKATTENLGISVSGRAVDFASYDRAISSLGGILPSKGKVVSLNILPPMLKPYILSAVKNTDSVSISGYYPDDATRSLLIDVAKNAVSTGTVNADLKNAHGQPDGFADLATFTFKQLKSLKSDAEVSAKFTLEDNEISISGRALDDAQYKQVKAALAGKLPANGKVVLAEILAPIKVSEPKISPYSVSAFKSKTSVVLNGYYPDEETHERLVAAAKKVMPKGNIVDNLVLGMGSISAFGDLGVKTISQLSRFSTGFVQVKDTSIKIRGTAKSAKIYDVAIAAAAGSFPANGKVTDVKINRYKASPFIFSATKKDGSVKLGGHVSNAKDETTIIAYAHGQNKKGSNRASLDIVNGEPNNVNWPKAMEVAVFGVNQLVTGKATLSDTSYSITGKALTDASYELAVNTGKTILSNGIQSVNVKVSRPPISPYKWQYSRTGESRKAALSGHVPSGKLANDNEKQIADALGTDAKIYNVLKIGSGNPRGFAAATSVAINTASRLVDGSATIVDTDLFVKGEALTQNAAIETRRQIENSLPPGFIGKHEITVRKAPEIKDCSTEISKVFVSNSIKFEIASDKINDVSRGLLDHLAAVSKACRYSQLTIEGHTDADGGEAYNLELSEARAKTVRSYLAFNGYLLGNLQTAGYGESKPIAPNDTQAGKALNRRINIFVNKN